MNALYLKDLADKTRRGLEGRVRAGRSGGGLCYGYDVVLGDERGGRAINPDDGPCPARRRLFVTSARPLETCCYMHPLAFRVNLLVASIAARGAKAMSESIAPAAPVELTDPELDAVSGGIHDRLIALIVDADEAFTDFVDRNEDTFNEAVEVGRGLIAELNAFGRRIRRRL